MKPAEVVEFWFSDRAKSKWFDKDEAFDDEIRAKFGAEIDRAAGGAFDGWLADPLGALAVVVLCDQFPRNIYRNSPRAFAQDAKAREVARIAIDRGHDRAVSVAERMFFYLPFEHSELLADQDRSVELFTAWAAAHVDGSADEEMKFVHRHREIVARFGRFPHRNAALGRESTPEELAFLTEKGSSF